MLKGSGRRWWLGDGVGASEGARRCGVQGGADLGRGGPSGKSQASYGGTCARRARARQGVRALGVWEEDVFDALSAPLDGLHHRLEVAVGRDEDGGIISVLEGAGEHVDS